MEDEINVNEIYKHHHVNVTYKVTRECHGVDLPYVQMTLLTKNKLQTIKVIHLSDPRDKSPS